MTNPYYSPTGNPTFGGPGASATIRAEFLLISAGFDKMPGLPLIAGAALIVNGAGTGFTTTGALSLASAFTTTGAFTTTLVQGANVSLTLPIVSGTLATLAGAETLSNKTFVAPALGTPSSGVATNLTGTASGLTAGSTITNANMTGPITSSGNATAVAAQTGIGSTFVMQTSPALTTPALGAATATSINGIGIAGTNGKTLTVQASLTLAGTDGKTLTVANSLQLVGTDGTAFTFPNTTDTVVTLAATQTLTNKTITALASASTATTQAIGDNSTKFATTAYADRQVGQIVSTETGALNTGTTITPFDDTIPQSGEGDQYMSLTITPKSATSTLIIDIVALFAVSANTNSTVSLIQDSTANALAAWPIGTTGNFNAEVAGRHIMTSGTTSATTFKVRIGNNAGSTTTFNGNAGVRLYGGFAASSITIREVL